MSVCGATQKVALAELDKVQDRLDEGKPAKDATSTVGTWLVHWRTTTLAASDRKDATKELYANISRKHLEFGPFGAMRLDRLKPSYVEALVLSMRVQTRPGKPTKDDPNPEPVRALSDSTVSRLCCPGVSLRARGCLTGGRGVRGSSCTCWTSSTRSASTSAMCECAAAGAAWDRSPLTDR